MQNIRLWLSGLPESKKYVELLTALLTIPVLVTVTYLNVNNIKKETITPNMEVKAEQPNVIVKEYIQPVDENVVIVTTTPSPTSVTPTSTSSISCTPGIGSLEISSPSENQTVSENPLCITIDYEKGNHCAVVWSYRINDSDWSDYDDKSVCLYDMPSGDKTLELRVKSIASGEEKKVQRTFSYKNNQNLTPTPTPITTTPTPTP